MTRENILNFAWWNTKLCPPGRRGAPVPAHRGSTAEVVRQLVNAESLDLLALGEVTADQAEWIHTNCLQEHAYRPWIESPSTERRPRNLAVFYDGTKLRLLDTPRSLYDSFGNRSLHVGMHMRFALHPFSAALHVFVVHWPARMNAESEAGRVMLGSSLQARFDEVCRSNPPATHVVVIGDFNDEPFDDSLSISLKGSRDRNLVRSSRSKLLYNPFWRLLGEQQVLEEEPSRRLAAGSHYYKNTLTTHWHCYDQFLVSSSLLSLSGWVLKEADTRIWQKPPLVTSKGGILPPFDHLPILGALSYIATVETAGA